MSGGLSVAEVLDRAADLIEPEGAWTQNDFCDAEDGGASWQGIKAATCWCAYGAVAFVLGVSGPQAEMWGCDNGLDEIVGPGGVVDYNDSHLHAEVVAKLREAAAIARTKTGEA